MTFESYYGDALPRLKQLESRLLSLVGQYPVPETAEGLQPILYCKSRIKTPESMMRKLQSRGLPTDSATALRQMHDAVGIRVVCSFAEDVYLVSRWLQCAKDLQVVQVKDYIAYPKPNGYRSLHLIVRFSDGAGQGLMAEIQMRTIAIDAWAALEHQMKYKRDVSHERMIQQELKRCADEISSVDVSMQTLRELMREDSWEKIG